MVFLFVSTWVLIIHEFEWLQIQTLGRIFFRGDHARGGWLTLHVGRCYSNPRPYAHSRARLSEFREWREQHQPTQMTMGWLHRLLLLVWPHHGCTSFSWLANVGRRMRLKVVHLSAAKLLASTAAANNAPSTVSTLMEEHDHIFQVRSFFVTFLYLQLIHVSRFSWSFYWTMSFIWWCMILLTNTICAWRPWFTPCPTLPENLWNSGGQLPRLMLRLTRKTD